MKKIDIQINQAKIESFSVLLNDDIPYVSASVGLYAGQKLITNFTLSTSSYGGIEFKLPSEMISPILEIAKELEIILIREANKQLNILESSK